MGFIEFLVILGIGFGSGWGFKERECQKKLENCAVCDTETASEK